jgi:hypothetical protein
MYVLIQFSFFLYAYKHIHIYIYTYIYIYTQILFRKKNLAHIGLLEEIPGVRLPWRTGPRWAPDGPSDVGDFTRIPVLTNKKRPKIDGKSPFFSWKNG